MMERSELLSKLQAYNFAAYDLLLYLDTHPDDKSAFKMFGELVSRTNELKTEYEKDYGPLTAFSSASRDSFSWLNSPWPWEKEGNK